MLIDMSVSAGVLIVLTIILEKIAGNYFSKRFIVTMWKIVLLRLIIPINLPITFGIAKPFIGMVRGAKNILGGLFGSENKSRIYYAAGVSVMSKPQNLYSENNNINLVLTGWGLVAAVFAVCIHWFNPLVWLMYVFINRDIEMACDEQVILRCGEDFRKEYAMVLLNLAEKQYKLSFFANGFGKNSIKERIVAIMKFKKTTTIGALGAAVILAGAVTVFTQNGIAQAFTEANSKGEIRTEQVSGKKQSVATDELKKSGEVKKADDNDNKAQAKTDISKTSEEDKKSKVAVEINDVEEYAEGDSVSCTAYADGTATYYVNGKRVKLTEDELKKLEKDGKVTIKIKNLKEK